MTTATEKNNTLFNQVEELVGFSPSADTLRNALYALLEEVNPYFVPQSANHLNFVNHNVAYFANQYETARQIHKHIGDCICQS